MELLNKKIAIKKYSNGYWEDVFVYGETSCFWKVHCCSYDHSFRIKKGGGEYAINTKYSASYITKYGLKNSFSNRENRMMNRQYNSNI